ncbi:MAG: helix-turn-helix domain-containing protein [Armatimonadota bacterium]
MQHGQTYTISEAAALSGRHPNTIRQKIKSGQLEASVSQGKYGEEYRITFAAMVEAGLLPEPEPQEPVLDAEITPEAAAEPAAESAAAGTTAISADAAAALTSLRDLYQRHEQAMYRLGYLQGEMERLKALEETAESLRETNTERERELTDLRRELEDKERAVREAESLRAELERTRGRLREMETLRQDIDQLKELASQQERVIKDLETTTRKRSWWQIWK